MVSYKLIKTTYACGPAPIPIIDLGKVYRIGKIEFGTDRGAWFSRWIYISSDCSQFSLLYSANQGATITWTGDVTTRCIRADIDYGPNVSCATVNIYELLYASSLTLSSDKTIIAYPDNQFTVSGNVKDQYNSPMAGQTVNIEVSREGTVYFSGTVTTDSNGNYTKTIITAGQTLWLAGVYAVKATSDSAVQSLNIETYYSGSLTVNATCADTGEACPADVYIDDNFAGTTPLTVTLPAGDHNYRISRAGYVDVTGVKTVEYLVPSTVNAVLNRIPNVLFNTSPQGARIIINDSDTGVLTPGGIFLNPGTYSFILRLPCYEDSTGEFTVTDSIVTVDRVLVKNTGDISISSTPPANVYLDGVLTGMTPLNLVCQPEKTYEYLLVLANYQSYRGSLTMVRNRMALADITLLPLGPVGAGSIAVISNPLGADISIDGVPTGKVAPYVFADIPVGTHTVTLDMDGYEVNTSSVTVEENVTSEIKVPLTPCFSIWECELGLTGYEVDGCGRRRQNTRCMPKGSISFGSTPEGAEIFIDGVDQNIATPAIITDITGTHTFTLRKEGYNDYSGTVIVEEGKIVEVDAALLPAEGCVSFNIAPAGARIFIDNVDTGQVTPALVCGLSLGIHDYRLVLAGYNDITGIIDLTAGQGTTVTGTLAKAGVGAGAVLGLTLIGLGALGAVVATRNKQPEPPREFLKLKYPISP